MGNSIELYTMPNFVAILPLGVKIKNVSILIITGSIIIIPSSLRLPTASIFTTAAMNSVANCITASMSSIPKRSSKCSGSPSSSGLIS